MTLKLMVISMFTDFNMSKAVSGKMTNRNETMTIKLPKGIDKLMRYLCTVAEGISKNETSTHTHTHTFGFFSLILSSNA